MQCKHGVAALALALIVMLAACAGPGPRATPTTILPARAPHAGDASLYPRADLTPGATDPRVTQATIKTTICVPGYTATVRPPVSVTGPMKRASMRAYGVTEPAASFEYDHLVPLELGGAPADPRNLWPEHHADGAHPIGSQQKDLVENALHMMICDGTMTLADAQHALVTDWYRAYLTLKQAGTLPATVIYDPDE